MRLAELEGKLRLKWAIMNYMNSAVPFHCDLLCIILVNDALNCKKMSLLVFPVCIPPIFRCNNYGSPYTFIKTVLNSCRIKFKEEC